MKSLAARFREKVDRSGDCWLWLGTTSSGYGKIWVREKGAPEWAHRVAWALEVGPIPEGLHVLHRCDNRRCVRVSHLFLGTNADNVADMIRKGRYGRAAISAGIRRSWARLSTEEREARVQSASAGLASWWSRLSDAEKRTRVKPLMAGKSRMTRAAEEARRSGISAGLKRHYAETSAEERRGRTAAALRAKYTGLTSGRFTGKVWVI